MKALRWVMALLVIGLAGLVWMRYRHEKPTAEAVQGVTNVLPATKVEAVTDPKKAKSGEEWLRLSEARLKELETLGELPENPSEDDLRLVVKTSWWGKPIDREKFWANGRVRWMDGKAKADAFRKGRGWPPIPPEINMNSLPAPKNDADRCGEPGLESAGPKPYGNGQEDWFWSKWHETHPHPPTEIEGQLESTIRTVTSDMRILACNTNWAQRIHLKPGDFMRAIGFDSACIKTCFPSEMYGEPNTELIKLIAARRVYDEITKKDSLDKDAMIKRLEGITKLDRAKLAEPLSASDQKATNAWKGKYLRRLQKEDAEGNAQYINAYLQAWQLLSNEVFAAGQ